MRPYLGKLSAGQLVERVVRDVGRGEAVQHPRWVWVSAMFSLDADDAKALCRKLGYDPEAIVGRGR